MADHPIWRKIEVRMWGDKKFRALSPLPPSGQGLWFFLLTGPHTGPIPGLLKSGRAAMAEELGWPQEAFDKAFEEVFALGMAKADWQARFVWIPNAIRCNLPQSPNVIMSWTIPWQLMPECELKLEAYQGLKSAIYSLGESFTKAFEKACPKPYGMASPNQEQETDSRKQEQERNACVAASATPAAPVIGLPLNNGTDYQITSDVVQEWAGLYPAVDVLQEFRNMRGWLLANKNNRKTKYRVLRFVTGWLAKEQNKAPRSAESPATPQHPVRLEYSLPANLDEEGGCEVWKETLGKLSKRVNPHSYDTWLKPIKAAAISGRTLYVQLPTPDFSHVGEKYGSLLSELLGDTLRVEFVVPREIAC